MALSILAYNLMRVMNIIGIKPLIGARGLARSDFDICGASQPLRMLRGCGRGRCQAQIARNLLQTGA